MEDSIPNHSLKIPTADSSTQLVKPDVDAKMPPSSSSYNLDQGNVVYQIVYPYATMDDRSQTLAYGNEYQSTNACTKTPSEFSRPVTPIHVTPPDSSEGSPTVPVVCGNITGKLHVNLFLCPGIHQPCVEYDGELLSPKQFTVRGDKEKQKDWKASIRIGRSTLRSHMEAGTVDFYDHEHRCSGKCQSRNYVNSPAEREEVMMMRKAKRIVNNSLLHMEITGELTGLGNDAQSGDSTIDGDKKGVNDVFKEKKARGRPRGSGNKNRPPKREAMKMDKSDQYFEYFEPDEDMINPNDLKYDGMEGCTSFAEILQCLLHDPSTFWSQMHNTGVISHFCDDIVISAINLKHAVTTSQHQLTNSQAEMLTRAAFAFSIQSTIVQRVQAIELSVAQQRKHNEMMMQIFNKKEEKDQNNNNVETSNTNSNMEAGDCAMSSSSRVIKREVHEIIDVVGPIDKE
ncbi:unnamed protein product [Caenorhabditis bovis]|uniref:SAND domain-containing protein n=1 Tax=Caenorhabditis bovis TaxID=2654633 RepID=A0A8S1EUJ8_9PELO|nr:unnamed protein product [Caenorhabditis bovis]